MIVQKFGGATVESPEHIKRVSERLKNDLARHKKMIVVVSAMGKTTNDLLQLAFKITPRPNLRELDMLLTTGERIAASLLTMSLLDQGVKATSLTGSQAGIVTDEHHFNAHILEIRPERLIRLMQDHDIIVLAGFQGVSATHKNITTLGRGGSDTTAIAIAAALNASACHIIKEVPAVFSADPKLVTQAQPIEKLTFEEAAQMTFWGAKVLHYRSVKLAQRYRVPVYVGPVAEAQQWGTWISQPEREANMFETTEFYAVTSYPFALELRIPNSDCIEAQRSLRHWLNEHHVIDPFIIHTYQTNQDVVVILTGPLETIQQISTLIQEKKSPMTASPLAVVSLLARPVTSPDLQNRALNHLRPFQSAIRHMFFSDMGIHLCVHQNQHDPLVKHLHALIENASD